MFICAIRLLVILPLIIPVPCQLMVIISLPRCPLGQKLTGVGTCIDINECAARPCIHGDCVDLVNDFNCNCHDGWEGKVCNSQKLVAAAVLSTGAILAIVICLIILLSKYTSRQGKMIGQYSFYIINDITILVIRYCINGIFYRPLIFAIFALPMIAWKYHISNKYV